MTVCPPSLDCVSMQMIDALFGWYCCMTLDRITEAFASKGGMIVHHPELDCCAKFVDCFSKVRITEYLILEK